MPTVKPKESRSDFVSRCVPIVLGEGATQAHAIAKCNGIYEQTQNEERDNVLEQKALRSGSEGGPDIERAGVFDNTVRGSITGTGRKEARQTKDNAQPTVNRTRVVPSNPLKADPTRSATLRRIFTTDISVRFTRLKRKVWRLIVDQDAFGLTGTQNKERNDERHVVSGSSERFEGDSIGENRRDREETGQSVGSNGTGELGKSDSECSNNSRLTHGGRPTVNAERLEQGDNIEFSTDSIQGGRTAVENTQERIALSPTTNAKGRRTNSIKARHTSKDSSDGDFTVNAGRWAFQTDKRKVNLFEKWLKTQVQIDVLTVTEAKASEAYWKKYVQQGYEKGAGRAFDDVRKPALASGQEQLAFFEGTKEEFLRQSFARPVAIKKVKRLAERVFTGLKDVTDDMDNILRQQLTEGLTQGMNPKDIARKMIKEGIGDKTRGVQSRAERIARTEIIRAHAEGQLDALEDLGVTEVGVMVEWSSAGDDRVCPMCSALDGVVLTIKEARGILPRHPNCRCAHIPANVGESKKGQQRSKTEVKGAFDDSIAAERKKGSFAEKKDKSKWLGADKTIVKDRPRGVLDKPEKPTTPKAPTLEPAAKLSPKPKAPIVKPVRKTTRDLAIEDLRKQAKPGKNEVGYLIDADMGKVIKRETGKSHSVAYNKTDLNSVKSLETLHSHSNASGFSDGDWGFFFSQSHEEVSTVVSSRNIYVLKKGKGYRKAVEDVILGKKDHPEVLWKKTLEKKLKNKKLREKISSAVGEQVEDNLERIVHEVNKEVVAKFGNAFEYEVTHHARNSSIRRLSSKGATRKVAKGGVTRGAKPK